MTPLFSCRRTALVTLFGLLLLVTIEGALLIATSPAETIQAESTTIWKGVFTPSQAKRGSSIYTARCAPCHGDSAVGGGLAPNLAGPDILERWTGMTVADLFGRIYETMPTDAPKSLTPREIADLMAYLFELNKWPSGEHELGTELSELKLIQIRADQ
jgi:cytochrome c